MKCEMCPNRVDGIIKQIGSLLKGNCIQLVLILINFALLKRIRENGIKTESRPTSSGASMTLFHRKTQNSHLHLNP